MGLPLGIDILVNTKIPERIQMTNNIGEFREEYTGDNYHIMIILYSNDKQFLLTDKLKWYGCSISL